MKHLKGTQMQQRILICLESLLISVDLLGTGGGCVPLRVGTGDWCDTGENGIISKMSVEGDLGVTLLACKEDSMNQGSISMQTHYNAKYFLYIQNL